MVWDVIILATLIYYAIWIPIRWSDYQNVPSVKAVDLSLDAVGLIDVILMPFTAVTVDQVLVKSKRRLLNIYLW